MSRPARTLELSLHGLPVRISCRAPALDAEIDRAFAPFAGRGHPPMALRTTGQIFEFDPADVLRHVSPTARAITRGDLSVGLYEEGERFWLVDDRWGMAEINLLRGAWRSWVLPHRPADAVHCMEMAVLWPLAQLLRPRGLHLLPAAAVVKDDYATLLLSPFGIVPELEALLARGYRLIGQRWTAARVENDRVHLLHMPGRVERFLPPRKPDDAAKDISSHAATAAQPGAAAYAPAHANKTAANNPAANNPAANNPVAYNPVAPAPYDRLASAWTDLTENRPELIAPSAVCNAAIIVSPGRRASAHITAIHGPDAAAALRNNWPIAEVHPNPQARGRLAALLARQCHCGHVQLSRRPVELAMIFDALRIRAARGAGAQPQKVTVVLHRAALRAMLASRQTPQARAG
jgi:hypothetical protein